MKLFGDMNNPPENRQTVYVLVDGVWRYGYAEYYNSRFLQVHDPYTRHSWRVFDEWIDADAVPVRPAERQNKNKHHPYSDEWSEQSDGR